MAKKIKLQEPDIKVYKVDSTNIEKLEYDRANEILYTTFKSTGKKYAYEGVSKELVKEIKNAESIGSMHHKRIIAAGFKGTMVD